MHDLAFADAARPTRVVCLRLPLLPYSVGHELILWNQRNPLLLASRDEFNALPIFEQRKALIKAVIACYRNWGDNNKPEKGLRLWLWLIRKTDWAVAVAEFRNYLESGRSLVPALSNDARDKEVYDIANGESSHGAGRALGAPFIAQLVLFATSTLRIPINAAYDLPFSVIGNLYYTQLEADGRLNIENQKEAEIRAEMEEHRRAAADEELSAQKEKANV
jgi:hypothetical protein